MRRAPSNRALLAACFVAAAIVASGPSGCRRADRPNVVIITVDTLRADRLGCYGFGLAHTPAIDALAKEGVRCTDAASSAPITLPAHCSIMTGLYPPAHGVRDNGNYALGPEAVTLAERLSAVGYRTGAFVSAAVLARRYGLDQGFATYDDDLWSEDEPELFMIRDRPAERTADRALAWLEDWRRQPGLRLAPRAAGLGRPEGPGAHGGRRARENGGEPLTRTTWSVRHALDFSGRRVMFAEPDGVRVRREDTMRVLAATLLVLVLGARPAQGQGSQCTYANQYFSSGSISCQNGKQYRCVAGSWQPNGLECADTNADEDQPGLDVDPSRSAPGVRQPAPPAVPQD